jgi:hypothetical protein
LEKAVKLANDPDFRLARSYYHLWLAEVIRNGLSQADAVAEMQKHVDACNDIIRQKCNRTRAKRAFLVTKVGMSVAAGAAVAGAIILPALVPIVGTAVISIAEYKYLGSKPEPQMPVANPAVMFITARRALGLR